ncbi:MAG: GDYXXLXY domain-containing protein [Azonexus sp.]|jgi:uncharacterized membrane-anchored protein/uncharacterized membrane protein|uniref:GDYXXLXY domain-containing protein n=1 Tax=Azonexus sp. TaxID=1872668 RepID=UPI00282BCF54|nr:GDYXXLXY domain-containing protein [Azonexus sp.]MDR0776073.1 GDYXXLXY domain-containing protein [Azonexus sp.]
MLDSGTQHAISARFLRVLTSIGAAGLFAFGVICWIAANWSDFHRLTRLSLVGALLLLAAFSALLIPRARIPALLVATAATGGLLALIGQIYPSGADAWQLFAYWTLLSLPFALAARHDAVWTLWVVVASAAIGLWHGQTHGSSDRGVIAAVWPAWMMVIGLALAFAPLAPLRAMTGQANWAFRLASLGAVVFITMTGLYEMGHGGGVFFVALLILLAAAGGLLVLRPFELGVLTIVFAGIDVLLIGKIFDSIRWSSSELLTIFLIGLVCAAIVGGSVALLRVIHARLSPARESADKQADRQGVSWPLVALSGLGALLAAVPFVLFFGFLLRDFGDEKSAALVTGIVVLGGAILLLRGGAMLGFRQIFGFIAAVVGVVLIGWGAASIFRFADLGFVLAAVVSFAAIFIPARWARSVCGFTALWMLFASVVADGRLRYSDSLAIVSMTLIVAAGAAVLAYIASRKDAFLNMRPFFTGWNAAGLLVLMLLAGRPFLLGAGVMGGPAGLLSAMPLNDPALIVSSLLGIAGAAFLFWRRPDLRAPLGFAVAICAVALTLRAPALGAAMIVFAVAIVTQSRNLAVAAALAVAWIISAFYYDLAWPLAQKGYVLMGLGAALGLAAFLTRSRGGEPLIAPRFAGTAVAFILLGLLATLGVASMSAYSAERILRDGRVIYLALRPVDPRSLVQGDYMALAFDVSQLPAPYDVRGTVFALADVDEQSVVTLRSVVSDHTQPRADQLVLKLRVKSNRWFVGSDAYFFKEGTGDKYAAAKFGQFRVGSDGRMLLAGLADQNLQPLP